MTTTKLDLGEFENQKVIGTTIAIKRAGDGLSKALDVEPQLMHSGDTVFVVLECVVGQVSFVPVKDTSEVERLHVLKAGRASFADRKSVVNMLEDTATKIQAARDEATNAAALDLDYNPLGVGEDGERTEPEPAPAKPARATRARKAVKAPAKKPRALKAVDPS